MAEQEGTVSRLVSIDIAERFEALQDEVDLIKIEIKQTLVDLREFIMKERTLFPQPSPTTNGNSAGDAPAHDGLGRDSVKPASAVPTAPSNGRSHGPSVRSVVVESQPVGHLDSAMLGGIIRWFATVKDRGLSLQQITPYLEAYETSGYLNSEMVKVILKAVADLDQLKGVGPEGEFSPQDYSECIGQLHDIICPTDSAQNSPSVVEASSAGPDEDAAPPLENVYYRNSDLESDDETGSAQEDAD